MKMTLEELATAYKMGDVPAGMPILLDNDQAMVYNDHVGTTIFEMHPQELLEQALTLLGIPWENV